MSLTLCLIVKDEEVFLDGCLASAAEACGEIVVVDTGSTDATKEIARSYGARVYDFGMQDGFAAARNAALDRVTTDWVLFLDADERFIEPELAKIPQVLAAAAADVHAFRVLRYNFFATGGFFTARIAKLMRNLPHVRYRRRISESVRRSIVDAGGRVADAPLVLNHFGHTRPHEARMAKARRYLQLMQEHLVQHPGEAGMLCNAAMVQLALGRVDDALAACREAVSIDPRSGTAHYYLGHMLRAAGHPADALDAYRRAVEIDPGDATFHNMVGVMQLTLGRLDEADETLRHAGALAPDLLHVEINRGLVWQARGAYASAAEVFRAVAQRNPGFLVESWSGRAELDIFSCLYNETIVRFAGLGYHIAYCEFMSRR